MGQERISSKVVSSSRFTRASSAIRFRTSCFFRSIRLLLRSKREIQVLQVNHHKLWRFDNAFLWIELKAKNVVWIQVAGLKLTHRSNTLLVDLSKIQSKKLQIKLVGFRQQRLIEIDVTPEERLQSHSFATSIQDFPQLDLDLSPITVSENKFELHTGYPLLDFPSVQLQLDKFSISHSSFKMSDYI